MNRTFHSVGQSTLKNGKWGCYYTFKKQNNNNKKNLAVKHNCLSPGTMVKLKEAEHIYYKECSHQTKQIDLLHDRSYRQSLSCGQTDIQIDKNNMVHKSYDLGHTMKLNLKNTYWLTRMRSISSMSTRSRKGREAKPFNPG